MTVTITVGTSYFVNRRRAIRYYRGQGFEDAAGEVTRKFMAGEIHFGKPKLKVGESLVLMDDNCRYGIESNG